AGGVPVDVDAERLESRRRTRHPALVGEVLGPAVKAAPVTPDRLDDAPDAAVTPREQPLDDAGLAVVVAEPDGRAIAAVRPDLLAEPLEPRVGLLDTELRRPLERSMRLRDETTDRHRAADVPAAADLPTGLDDALGQLCDLEDVLVGLGRQAAHEVELDLSPARAVRRGDGADEILLAHHLVDDSADPLAATLGGEGEAGPAPVAGQLVGQVDVERVDARRRQ